MWQEAARSCLEAEKKDKDCPQALFYMVCAINAKTWMNGYGGRI